MGEIAPGRVCFADASAFSAYVEACAAARHAALIEWLASLPSHERRRSFFAEFEKPRHGRSAETVLALKRAVMQRLDSLPQLALAA